MPTPEEANIIKDLIGTLGFPIVLLVILCFITLWIIKQIMPQVQKYFDAKTENMKEQTRAQSEQVTLLGEFNELMRNNTCVIENNTATMSIVKSDRALMIETLTRHAKESKDAHSRLETIIGSACNDHDKMITKLAVLDTKLDTILPYNNGGQNE